MIVGGQYHRIGYKGQHTVFSSDYSTYSPSAPRSRLYLFANDGDHAGARGNLPRFQEPLQLKETARADISRVYEKRKYEIVEKDRRTSMTAQTKNMAVKNSPGGENLGASTSSFFP